MRRVAGILAVTVRVAAAEPTTDQCVDAYKTSQQLRHDGALRAARERLLMCARDPCPKVLQTDCVTWLAEVEPLVPSVVVKATLRGTTIADVRVLMDGVELAPRLDGRAIDVDPGQHVFSFEHAGAKPASETVLIVQGERGHVIEVALTPAPVRSVVEERHEPRIVYDIGAVGLGALGVGGVFGTLGLLKRSDLSSCKPYCSQTRLDEVSHRFLAADIAFAVGAVALGTAAALHWTRPAVDVSAAPTSGGAMLWVRQPF